MSTFTATFAGLVLLLGSFATRSSDEILDAIPTLIEADAPEYPAAALMAAVSFSAELRVWTDGERVSRTNVAEVIALPWRADVNKIFRSWRFAPHQPTSFISKWRFELDGRGCEGNKNISVAVRLPTEAVVTGPARALCGSATSVRPPRNAEASRTVTAAANNVTVLGAAYPVFPAAAIESRTTGRVEVELFQSGQVKVSGDSALLASAALKHAASLRFADSLAANVTIVYEFLLDRRACPGTGGYLAEIDYPGRVVLSTCSDK